METITAIQRNYNGEIINFVTSEGRVISYRKALLDVEQGLIQGLQTVQDTNGALSLMPELEQSFDDYPNLF
ncbi:hypothetical protein FB550_102132 [Neobacillus bataviensis]|jgi:hypothetical protein|uniref:DUF3892 domain-containing protein n=1 Tax=Neobacillus bataviensis TaxID=220685 RepID=A0A561DRY2_9BACI|nr:MULTISPECIES: DUF3892 domain-containing protein [Bacillaceae]PFO02483.1 hypothetical protein COJ85_16360 [Bacillus sp. AFS076308]PGV55610.1 hypothetical protein COD92_01450 [Bacillus sp. AFS037270]TWE06114.1 hypothetical protein FB550_102132 [Neobacillus bataviensis]